MKWILVGIIILCNAAADIFDTVGMRLHGKVRDFGPAGLLRFTGSLFHNRYVLGGVAALIVSFFALTSLLSIAPVSFALPATAGSFLLETALAKVLLKEEVHRQRWAGAAVIAVGLLWRGHRPRLQFVRPPSFSLFVQSPLRDTRRFPEHRLKTQTSAQTA